MLTVSMKGLDFHKLEQLENPSSKKTLKRKNSLEEGFLKKQNISSIKRRKKFSSLFFSKDRSSPNITSIILSLGLFFFFLGMLIGSFYERSYSKDLSWIPKYIFSKSKDNVDQKKNESKKVLSKKQEYQYSNIPPKKTSILKKNTIRTFFSSQVEEKNKLLFHLYVKKYSSEKEAVYYGRQLKRLKLDYKVFVTKNKGLYKLYIGPIEGKNKAYSLMQKIKSISEFQGAILYKNS